jgi:YggT family protein
MISRAINLIFYFYYILIVLRIFLTWIPNIEWDTEPFRGLRMLTDPFLNIFRGIIPPIGGVLDISPILAIILLQILQGFVVGFIVNLGL